MVLIRVTPATADSEHLLWRQEFYGSTSTSQSSLRFISRRKTPLRAADPPQLLFTERASEWTSDRAGDVPYLQKLPSVGDGRVLSCSKASPVNK